MSNGSPAEADTSDPPPNSTTHPHSACDGDTQSKDAPRRDSKVLRPVSTSELREKLKDKKGKLADRKEQLKNMSKPPGGFDATPLPDAPQGYTIKITFHRAYNLPVADLHLRSSDPFIHATLTASVPKRHKEDPLLTRRTRTIRRSTEPVWDEDWVVANVPASGFQLKCRLYDEDWPDHDDRLGNVTIRVPQLDENWEGLGPNGRIYEVKKRAGSKRAYLYHGVTAAVCRDHSMTPRLHVSIDVLGKSDPPHAQMYTVGPTTWVKHYSPMIGRLAGVRVNRDEEEDAASHEGEDEADQRRTKKYDFQANEIQLSGPVPPELYHRYVEFRPMIGRMFSSQGLRGRILNKVLHKQHSRIYNFDSGTEYGAFPPCSDEASLQFLRMAHFDEGGRIFTYVLTLDGMLRFTETGKEFGIDMLSKHTMHSDVATYIACSGEFFIRRLAHPVNGHGSSSKHGAEASSSKHDGDPSSSKHGAGPSSHHTGPSSHHDAGPSSSNNDASEPATSNPASPDQSPHSSNPTTNSSHPSPTTDPSSNTDPSSSTTTNSTNPPTHPPHSPPGGPPSQPPPPKPHLYRLTIDNDSGTYRPDKSVLPHLQAFLAHNFPGIDVSAMHCADEKLVEMKKGQVETKKREGPGVRMVMNRSPTGSSFSSSDESRLGRMDLEWGEGEDGEGDGGEGGGGGGSEGGGGRGGGGHGGFRSRRERALEVLGDPKRWRVLVGGGGKKK